jgi:transposase
MPLDSVETLREINDYLRRALIGLRPERRHCSTVTPRDFSAILNQLLRAAGLRDHGEPSAELEKELLEYRRNLERLKQLLPDLQGRLLAEKARLESARSQLTSAEVWARASKTTL